MVRLETEPTEEWERSGIGIQESRNQRYECHLGIPRLQKRVGCEHKLSEWKCSINFIVHYSTDKDENPHHQSWIQ